MLHLFIQSSVPVGKYGRFSVSQKKFFPAFFLETVKDNFMKYSGMLDLCF
jgi:hypothetical protein